MVNLITRPIYPRESSALTATRHDDPEPFCALLTQNNPFPNRESNTYNGRPVQSLASIVNELHGLEFTVTSTLLAGRFSGVVHFFDTKEISTEHGRILPRVSHFVIQP